MRRTIQISEEAYQVLSRQSEKEGKSRKDIASFDILLIAALESKKEKTDDLWNNKEKNQPVTAEEAYLRAAERRKRR